MLSVTHGILPALFAHGPLCLLNVNLFDMVVEVDHPKKPKAAI